MARYSDPVCRICRKEGKKLFLKGDRCNTGKCAIVRRSYRPGQHGQKRHKVSEYGIRLKEKQKLRRIYGLLEKQFRKYYDMASSKHGVTGERLMQLLELRLDNIVYRLGYASSRPQARQLVRHGHILVNGRRVDIPSYQVKAGDSVNVQEKSRPSIQKLLETRDMSPMIPNWLSSNLEGLTGQILTIPARDEIETSVQENMVIEFYSR